MIARGQPWGRPAGGPPDVTVGGDDAALAAAVVAHPGARVAFLPAPASDFARATGTVGMHAPPAGGYTQELPCDLLRGRVDGREFAAVNMVVVGTAPDRQSGWTRQIDMHVTVDEHVWYDGRASAVICASGQHLRAHDVVPRGHPGDGRFEVQVYALDRRERRLMRTRLPAGAHVPHPDIRTGTGREADISTLRGTLPVEIDGRRVAPGMAVEVEIVPEAFLLLV
jgi:hypothetical protein